jgi:hypothetical protein
MAKSHGLGEAILEYVHDEFLSLSGIGWCGFIIQESGGLVKGFGEKS